MASPAATIAGGVVGGIGDLISGEAQQNLYNYKAAIALQNEKIAKSNAIYEQRVGEVEAETTGLKTAFQVGATKVAYAAGNIALTMGTAREVMASEIAVGQQSQAIVRANAAKRAFGFEVEAAGDEAQANIDKASGQNARTASYYAATATMLGAAGKAASQVGGGVQSGAYA